MELTGDMYNRITSFSFELRFDSSHSMTYKEQAYRPEDDRLFAKLIRRPYASIFFSLIVWIIGRQVPQNFSNPPNFLSYGLTWF